MGNEGEEEKKRGEGEREEKGRKRGGEGEDGGDAREEERRVRCSHIPVYHY